MRTTAAHVAPPDPALKRRRLTRITLASTVAVALAGSGIYIAGAQAEETAVPGRVQAEEFAAQFGAQTEGTGDTGGGRNVGWLANGDWLRYDGVSITGTDLTARVAAHNTDGGTVELRLGAQSGTLLASFPIAGTGGWQKWTTVTAKVSTVPAGAQTVFAVMRSTSRSDFVNLNWFTFGPAAGTTPSASPTPSPAASTPTPAPATPGTPTTPGTPNTPGTPAAGWVPVDQARWAKELAAFNAIRPKAVPPGTTRVPEFHTDCEVANSAPDDPIVVPGLPGASHMHTFFGPKIDAFTTTDKLLSAKTTCNAPGDLSAYWTPELRKDGKAVPIKSFRVYYGSRVKDPSTVKPFPPGLRMVEGDAKRQVDTPKNGGGNQFWCAGSAETGRSADGNWPVCAPGGNLIFQLVFKDCWDGKNIDSPDHKSHMGDPVNGVCTGKYPVAVPDLSFMVNYQSLGGTGLSLASGKASSMHGDFMNAWDPAHLGGLVKSCLNQNAKCGTEVTFAGG
ncbi:DUF1996 domain-containing protein [Micromonospora sp. ALFpr18c]|uniref:DUF1996 domain-containing protein n=1 Tax=unclassified Micromonospora TaxID=2617518 RepID=UPI00124BAC62|nr:DUF1996 domain-containing protein [Micromonospora sp. ALFpr18c]KAB1934911.1 DUF1996 domain-containing protein [Micromonospora sp. ALFpr18c]